MMEALDFTLNSVTMLALVLMVGIVIDDAIVVLENIFRFIEEKKVGPFEAARAATAEIALPVLATTLSLVVIFIPVSFMSSISGRFLYQFGITAAVAIMVSLLVSFTLTPMMSARLLRADDASGTAAGTAEARRARAAGSTRDIDRVYTSLLGWSMRHRLLIAGLAVVVTFSSIPLYSLVRQEFVPSGVDEGEFEVSVSAPEGTSLAAMNDALKEVETRSPLHPRRARWCWRRSAAASSARSTRASCTCASRRTRSACSAGAGSSAACVRLDPLDAFRNNYSQGEVMQEVRGRLRKFPELRGSVRNIQSLNLGGGRGDLDLAIRGPELTALADYGERLRLKAPEIGIVDADTTLKLNKPELQVQIDRERAADLGVNTDDIATALRVMVGGDDEVTRFRDSSVNDDYDVQLRLTEARPQRPDDPRRLLRAAEHAASWCGSTTW